MKVIQILFLPLLEFRMTPSIPEWNWSQRKLQQPFLQGPDGPNLKKHFLLCTSCLGATPLHMAW